jgi:PadR family transcriptional regulator PadR
MEPGTARPVLSQLRRGVLEYCVLALLRERPRYGFDLVRGLSDAGGLLTSEGTIYPLLSRLRREGLVTTTWQESDTGPPRRYYALSHDGAVALERFVADWDRFRGAVDAVFGLAGTRQDVATQPAPTSEGSTA